MPDAKGPAARAWKNLNLWVLLQRSDVVCASFPKCGRTWLRVLIGKAVCTNHGVDDQLVFDYQALSRQAGVAMPFFTHDLASNTEGRHFRDLEADKSRYGKKKVLFLHRDPRDVMVSSYSHATRRKNLFSGTISEFIRDPHYGIEKILTFYAHWEKAQDVPLGFHLVRYADLHAKPAEALGGVLRFLGEKVEDEAVAEAIEFASFSQMKKMEQAEYFKSSKLRAANPNDTESFKARKGVEGGYREALGEEDRKFLEEKINEYSSGFDAAG
jgi:hypothetical protein